jgi:hypothetical protein
LRVLGSRRPPAAADGAAGPAEPQAEEQEWDSSMAEALTEAELGTLSVSMADFDTALPQVRPSCPAVIT